MKAKRTMTDGEAMRKIKALLEHDNYEAIMCERKRINRETVPRHNALFSGLKLRYIETGETVTITEFGELFETIRARFPNGEVLWCSPEEFALIGREAECEIAEYTETCDECGFCEGEGVSSEKV